MFVIIVNGSSRTGKDNFAKFFMEQYKYKAYSWSTIDDVKEISKKNFGWNGKKTEEARRFLANIKKAWAEYNNGPFENMKNKINKHYSRLNKKNKDNVVYFIHCREPEEIQKFKDEYKENFMSILLKREDRTVPDNHADKNVDNYNYDKIIQNSGSKADLRIEATKFLEEIKNKK